MMGFLFESIMELEAHLAFVGKLCGVNVICLEVVDQGDLLVAGPGGQY